LKIISKNKFMILQKKNRLSVKSLYSKAGLLILIMAFFGYNNAFAQPANDDPCNAIPLTVGTDCVFTQYTNAAATASTGVPAPGCASYSGGDVWFTVVVPAGGSLIFDSNTGVITDGGMAIYSGTCNALTLIECDDDDSPNGNMPRIIRTGLTPGSTVWIRFWEFGNNNNGTFRICVSIPPPPPPPPVNDNPCNATLIPVGEVCNYVTYSTTGATATAGVPAPGCASYSGGDVWFKVVVPCTGRLVLDGQTGAITDGGMAIYRGSCNALTLIECDDDDSPNGLMPRIDRSGLVVGDTIWVRFWEFGNDASGTFGLCAQAPAAPIMIPPVPPSPNCPIAQPFCTSTTPYTQTNVSGGGNTTGGGIYGCLVLIPNPTYYYLQIQTSGSIQITISQVSTAGAGIDVDFVIWGPFTSPGAACGQLSAANIVDCSYSTAAVEQVDIPNAIAGQYYILLVTNFNGGAGAITYQQTGGTGSSACCTINATNSGAVCAGSGTLNLNASTVTNATYQWTGPNCFVSNQQNPTGVIPPSVPGVYTYTVTAVSSTGQVCSDTTRVTVLARPSLGPDKADTICAGSSFNLTTQFITTGLTANWTINNNPVATPASVTTGGIYQLIVSNAGGCSDTALFTLTVDQVSGQIETVNANCTDSGIIRINNPQGIAPFTYSLSTNPAVFQSSPSFNVIPGTYTITIRDREGCTSAVPGTVGFTDNLLLSARQDTTICRGQSVVLNTSSNATSYTWSPSAGLSSSTSMNPVATPDVTTNYIVTATLGSCTKTEEVIITVDESLSVDAGPDIDIVAGDSGPLVATASGSNITSILWTPSTGLSSTNTLGTIVTPTIPNGTITYTITVQNNRGCTASDDVLVTVIPNCIDVKNAFTPNGDGNNELWQVYDSYECLKNVTVHVFNRYGNKVFESRDYRNNWDGRYQGKSVPDATYYAVAEFTLISGRKITVKTDLTILR